ncbi:hypothetical protein GBA52_007092 [Prunus armeniaca]|nr:hypothetical protein GBA52_007092 [Prunus armeniaca]
MGCAVLYRNNGKTEPPSHLQPPIFRPNLADFAVKQDDHPAVHHHVISLWTCGSQPPTCHSISKLILAVDIFGRAWGWAVCAQQQLSPKDNNSAVCSVGCQIQRLLLGFGPLRVTTTH